MKVVHINKKDIEREKVLLEAGRELMRHQAALEYKAFMKRRAKKLAVELANKKAGL